MVWRGSWRRHRSLGAAVLGSLAFPLPLGSETPSLRYQRAPYFYNGSPVRCGCSRLRPVLPQTRVTRSGKWDPAQPGQAFPRASGWPGSSCSGRVRTRLCKPVTPNLCPGPTSLDPDNHAFHQIIQVGGTRTNMRLPAPQPLLWAETSRQPARTESRQGAHTGPGPGTLLQTGGPQL